MENIPDALTTVSRQSQHYPDDVIISDSKSLEEPFGIINPQIARIEGLTEGLKQPESSAAPALWSGFGCGGAQRSSAESGPSRPSPHHSPSAPHYRPLALHMAPATGVLEELDSSNSKGSVHKNFKIVIIRLNWSFLKLKIVLDLAGYPFVVVVARRHALTAAGKRPRGTGVAAAGARLEGRRTSPYLTDNLI
ncbi:jg27009, partial [Pararge aegeria aegeria]